MGGTYAYLEQKFFLISATFENPQDIYIYFYLEIFGLLAILSVGIIEVTSDYMLRGRKLIYVNKVPKR